ncbi:hypothetical protein CEXT_571 [Caerostris extrusa]|uniref:Ionotropic glutamate receptor C-terminal domain-containing protein n=1 Tax=Caerostris extrusa TaxID=172846 RepID=A0AAV4RQJ4_CAEEX|nr:hypothetical protein CEXT_571 [Caerostris extrusa]
MPFVVPVIDKDNKSQLGGVAKKTFTKPSRLSWLSSFYVAMAQPHDIYGAKSPNGTWSGMIGAMLNNVSILIFQFMFGWETDISGPYFVTEDRSHAMEFTVPLAFSQLTLLSGLVSSNRDPFLIFGVFSVTVWATLLLTTIVISATATLIYYMLPARNKRKKTETFSRYLWAFQSGLTGNEFGDNNRWFVKHVSSSPSFTLLQSLWFTVCCLVMMYTYEGAIISTFTIDKLRPKISTIEELLQNTGIGISTFRDSYPMAFFSKDIIVLAFPSLVGFYEDPIGVFLMKQRALAIRRRVIRHSNFTQCTSNSWILDLEAHDHTRMRRFSEGDLSKFKVIISTLHYDTCTGESMSVTAPLSLSDLAGAFIILVLGNAFALMLFVFEFLKRNRKK